MRIETAGRGGKSVTVLFNLPFTEDEAMALMKQLKSLFGCGATLKNSTIELQGDVRNRVREFFTRKGKTITG
ncbi:MAG: translation initiation factor [Syntrophaceae bacterium]